MPFLPIDTKEKTTATPQGTQSQPIVQSGQSTGGVGTGGGTGAGPKMAGSYTNLSSYLQANQGNSANANAANNAIVQGTAQASPDRNTGALLQQTFGNTYGNNHGNAALDSALVGQGVWGKPVAAPKNGQEVNPIQNAAELQGQIDAKSTPSNTAATKAEAASTLPGIFDSTQSTITNQGTSPSSGGAGHSQPPQDTSHVWEDYDKAQAAKTQADTQHMADVQSQVDAKSTPSNTKAAKAEAAYVPNPWAGFNNNWAFGGKLPEADKPHAFSKLMKSVRNK